MTTGFALPFLADPLVVGTAFASQPLATGEPIDIPIVRMVIALCVGIALAYLLVRFVRDRGSLKRVLEAVSGGSSRASGPREPSLKVLETHRLSTHGDVSLVACGDKRFVVAISQSGAVLLDRFDVVAPAETVLEVVPETVPEAVLREV